MAITRASRQFSRRGTTLLLFTAVLVLAPFTQAFSQVPPNWQSQDVGDVGTAGYGYADVGRGVWTVAGAGADIWDTSDAFHFLYRELHGDGTIEALVTDLDDTHTFAKAGVMIRESLAADSRHVLVNVRPNGIWELLARGETGGFTSASGGTGAEVPRRLRLVRRGDEFEALVSVGPATPGHDYAWKSAGTVTVEMPHNVYVGLAVTSHDPSVLNEAHFEGVHVVSPGLDGPLPAPWTTQDIGDPPQTGSATYEPGINTFAVGGSGADIWGTTDQFRFVSQPFSGDGEIVARVQFPADFGFSAPHDDPFAKAGLMLRESLAPDAAHVVLDVRPTGDFEFMTRQATGETTTFIAGGRFPYQGSLRLMRVGSTVTGAVSVDGRNWTTIGSVTTTIAADAHIGMAVTSHDADRVSTAWFQHVAAVGATPPAAGGEIVIYASDTQSSNRHGAWNLIISPESPNQLKVATGDDGYEALSAPVASPQHYVDIPFEAVVGTPYTFWIRLYVVNNSKWNDSVWVQFSDALVHGVPTYQMETTSGLLVNLATDSSASSLNGWGWANGAYWLSQPATVTFATTGPHTLRIHVREDGVMFDQIVLSSQQYLTAPPGPPTNDQTIVPKEEQ